MGFARLCLYNLSIIASGRVGDHAYVYDDTFDRTYGVDTLGCVEVDEIAAPDDLKRDAARYEATAPAAFHQLVGRAVPGDPSRFTFVDIGSGKGRVLLLAGLAGFRRVIGVELGSDLHAAALANVARMHAAGIHMPVEPLHLDATAFAFPPEPTICFLNNPFGPEPLARVLDRIEASLAEHPRAFRLVYLHCNHADVIAARPGWTEIDRGQIDNRRHPYVIHAWRSASERH